jgi:phosphohistidine phosphatase
MELYILRHGLAEERNESGRDRDRALTPEGKERTHAAGKALRKMNIEFDLVLSSPFVRAWQTAEILLEELECANSLQQCEALSSGAAMEEVLEALKKAEGSYESVLLVGHEPDLSQLISALLSGSPDLAITMKKGGLAKLTCGTVDPGSARLEWLLTSKHLCRLD